LILNKHETCSIDKFKEKYRLGQDPAAIRCSQEQSQQLDEQRTVE